MSIMSPHTPGQMTAMHLAQVLDNADPEGRGRLKIRMHATGIEIWASVIVNSAGSGYGVCCLPKVNEIVVIAFISPEQALIIGSIWSGDQAAPSEVDPVEDNYVVKTPAGTVMTFNDDDGPKMQVQTSSGYSITITEANGGEISIQRDTQEVLLNSSEVKVSGTRVVVEGQSGIELTAPQVTVNAAISTFSGTVQADAVIANCVVGSAYTPGAGNVW